MAIRGAGSRIRHAAGWPRSPRKPASATCASRPTLTLQDTYYDSADWMIFRAGFALRVREAREADETGIGETEITLKSLHQRARRPGAPHRDTPNSVGSAGLDEVLARDNGIGGRIRELVGSRPFDRAVSRQHAPRAPAACSRPTPTCRWPRSISMKPRSRRPRGRRASCGASKWNASTPIRAP